MALRAQRRWARRRDGHRRGRAARRRLAVISNELATPLDRRTFSGSPSSSENARLYEDSRAAAAAASTEALALASSASPLPSRAAASSSAPRRRCSSEAEPPRGEARGEGLLAGRVGVRRLRLHLRAGHRAALRGAPPLLEVPAVRRAAPALWRRRRAAWSSASTTRRSDLHVPLARRDRRPALPGPHDLSAALRRSASRARPPAAAVPQRPCAPRPACAGNSCSSV